MRGGCCIGWGCGNGARTHHRVAGSAGAVSDIGRLQQPDRGRRDPLRSAAGAARDRNGGPPRPARPVEPRYPPPGARIPCDPPARHGGHVRADAVPGAGPGASRVLLGARGASWATHPHDASPTRQSARALDTPDTHPAASSTATRGTALKRLTWANPNGYGPGVQVMAGPRAAGVTDRAAIPTLRGT